MDFLFQVESPAFTNIADKVLKQLYIQDKNPCNITSTAKDELKQMFVMNSYDIPKIIEEIHKRNWDKDKTDYFVNALNENKTKLLLAALADYNNSFGECVSDFSWAIKVILGTSELKSLKYPLLQLVLNTVNSGVTNKNVYEINKDVLAKVISVLETIE